MCPLPPRCACGWDDQNLTAPDLARALEDAGVAAVFVHGRTRAQGFDGSVNLDGIRRVVEAVKNIPVIGNGDVTTPEAAAHMIEKPDAMESLRAAVHSTTPGFFCIPNNFWKAENYHLSHPLMNACGFFADTMT